MRKTLAACTVLVAGLLARTLLAQSNCNVATIQSFAPSSSIITSASEQTYNGTSYCQINASINTNLSLGDVIHYQVDLPDPPKWNSRFLFAGNGGFAGSIALDLSNLSGGIAVAGTDTGHTGTGKDASWALNNRPAVLDYEYRAVHESAAASEQILTGYYSNAAYHSYFAACSNGGREGLVEVQDYPNDFEGVVAGDPVIGQPYLAFNWNSQAILAANGADYIDYNAINLVNAAVLAQCDGLDGVVDGLVQNPAVCNFQPSSLLCPSGQTTGCLSAGQVAAFNQIYAGPVDTKGVSLYPGLSVTDPSSSASLDAGWGVYIDGCTSNPCTLPNFNNAEPWGTTHVPTQWASQDAFFKNFIFDNANYDTRTLSFSNQGKLNQIESQTAGLGGEGENANISPFVNAGHKLLMYHGWSDPAFSPYVSINYYNSVKTIIGSNTSNDVKLFMVPGMHHCQGFGPGPNIFDSVTPMFNWVEQGIAPDGLIASHHINDDVNQPIDRTMPLCSYPEEAVYNGIGSVDDASSWSCA